MSAKKETHDDRKNTTQQQGSQTEQQNPETLSQQLHPATTIQRARQQPANLNPNQVRRLQGTIGNRALVQLLPKQRPTIQRTVPEKLTWKGSQGIFTQRSQKLKAIFTALKQWHDKKENGTPKVKFVALMNLLSKIDIWLPTKKGKWLKKHANRIAAVKTLRESVINELDSCVDQLGYDSQREYLREEITPDKDARWNITEREEDKKALTEDLPKKNKAGMWDRDPPKTQYIEKSKDKGETNAQFAFSNGAGPCVIIMMRAGDEQSPQAVGAIHKSVTTDKGKYRSVKQWVAVITTLRNAVLNHFENSKNTPMEFYVAGGQDDPQQDGHAKAVSSYAKLRVAFATENITPKGWSVPITLGDRGGIDASIGPSSVNIEMILTERGGSGNYVKPRRWTGTEED